MAFNFFHMGPGPEWGHRRQRRRFKRGMLKWIVLKLLAEGERHGYDVIREFEERGWGGGRAGSIYPVLFLLEQAGLVTSREEDGKRVYVISEKGRTLLRDRLSDISEHLSGLADDEDEEPVQGENDEVRDAAQKLMGAVMQGARGGKPETVRQIVDRLNAVRKEIYTLLANE